TFVDFDHGLNAAIRRLRDALGDSAENPRFVETVARRGYRFLARINGAAATVIAPSAPRFAAHSRRWRIFASAAVLLVGVAVGWVIAHWSRQPIQIKQQRLTANPEDDPVLGAAISPDGKYLAFADKTGVYLRQIDSGETDPLNLPTVSAAVSEAREPGGAQLFVSGL